GGLLYYSSGEGPSSPDLRVTPQQFDKTNSVPLTTLNTNEWEYSPYVRADGLELYYTVKHGSLIDDLFVSARANGDWAPGVPVSPLTTTAHNERAGVISDDGLTLYFASDAVSPPTYDVYMSRRATKADAFVTAALVAGLDTSADE